MVHMVKEETQLLQTQQLLDVKRIGGGNIVRYRPVFSPDSSTLFLVKGCVIEAYNVKTGAHIQDYVGLESPAIGVQLHPFDDDLLVACSEQGELISWTINTREAGRMVKLDMPSNLAATCAFRGFQLIVTPKMDGLEKCEVFATVSSELEQTPLPIIFCSTSGNVLKIDLDFCVDNHPRSYSSGGERGQKFVATISDNRLFVAATNDLSNTKIHMVAEPKKFTCVRCHPHEAILATGLSFGMIILWRNFLDKREVRSEYHWHTLPVLDVLFSHEGPYFYSGAAECVLIKWDMFANKSKKECLPRMSGPLQYLAISPNNASIAASTTDNAISLVHSGLLILSSMIQNMTWGVQTGLELEPMAAGIRVNPRNGALVLNGRVGHLQFFDPVRKALDWNLDITCQNYMSQERGRTIVNTSVVAMAFDTTGYWLATVEERDDHDTTPESRLKFWQYDETERTFSLSTTVERPHNGMTTVVEFRPAESDSKLLAATIGTDQKFRVWKLINISTPDMAIQEVWACESVGFYKSLQPGSLSFSQDGSLLAVTFACSLTVWTPVTCETKCSLTHPTIRAPIRHVQFGRKEACHLVATASDSCLSIWNLLSLSMAWTVDVSVSLLVADPLSSVMAVFTQNNDLFVFAPTSCQPLYKHNEIASFKAKVLKAVFCPRKSGERLSAGWQAASQLFFITTNQDVLGLEDPAADDEDIGLSVMQPQTKRRLTPFAALMAQHSVSDVKKLMPVTHSQLGNVGTQAVTEFLAAPCHTMPALSLLCGEFLRSFTNSSDSHKYEESSEQHSKMDVDEDNVKVEQLSKKLKKTRVSAVKPERLEGQLVQILEEDLDWVETYGINT